MVCGLVRADGEHVLLDGREITRLPMYQRAKLGVGYLPQDASIFGGLTAEQNIRAILQLGPKTAKQQQERLEELIEDFSLSRCAMHLHPLYRARRGGAWKSPVP